MEMGDFLFFLFLANTMLHLVQVYQYGMKEHNRPTLLFGVVFLFLAFALDKDQSWIKWACIMVPAVGFIGLLSGFSESLKPRWLNYTMMTFNLVLAVLSVIHFFT